MLLGCSLSRSNNAFILGLMLNTLERFKCDRGNLWHALGIKICIALKLIAIESIDPTTGSY